MIYFDTGCRYCGERHPWYSCPTRCSSDAPLETPSHNGEYRGDKSKIRVLAPGVSGEDATFAKMMAAYRKRGGENTRKRWGIGLKAMHRAKAEAKLAKEAKAKEGACEESTGSE